MKFPFYGPKIVREVVSGIVKEVHTHFSSIVAKNQQVWINKLFQLNFSIPFLEHLHFNMFSNKPWLHCTSIEIPSYNFSSLFIQRNHSFYQALFLLPLFQSFKNSLLILSVSPLSFLLPSFFPFDQALHLPACLCFTRSILSHIAFPICVHPLFLIIIFILWFLLLLYHFL